MDIVIYTNPETLLDKRRPGHYCWWWIKNLPIKLHVGDRIYFAIKGEVQGSFRFDCFDYRDGSEVIEFKADSWKQIEDLDAKYFCKPFRGFKYRWWKD